MDLLEKNKLHSNRHPWELSRNYSILKIIEKYPVDLQYADIGAGDLFFTTEIAKITNKAIYAVDINYGFIDKTANIISLKDLSSIQSNSIDCIFLLDVLEHAENDNEFLESILRLLKAKGIIIITVPAHQFLFSSHDIFLRHCRRYGMKQLIDLLKKCNLKIKENFYFFITLFLARFIQKILNYFYKKPSLNEGVGNWKFKQNHPITKILTVVLILDFLVSRFLGKHNIHLCGLSICTISQKQ